MQAGHVPACAAVAAVGKKHLVRGVVAAGCTLRLVEAVIVQRGHILVVELFCEILGGDASPRPEIIVPEDSSWGGKTLKELHLRERFGVDMSSIMRGSQRLNIPNGDTVIFPGDKLQVIGNDDQLQKFATALSTDLIPEDLEIEKREMKLRQLIISGKSEFCGKSLLESGIRDKYNCMVVGLEEGQENLTKIAPTRTFEKGDILWIVGEESDLQKIMERA